MNTEENKEIVRQWLVLGIERETRRAIKHIAEERGLTIAQAMKLLAETYKKVQELT